MQFVEMYKVSFMKGASVNCNMMDMLFCFRDYSFCCRNGAAVSAVWIVIHLESDL